MKFEEFVLPHHTNLDGAKNDFGVNSVWLESIILKTTCSVALIPK
jgi:hypothetical protein